MKVVALMPMKANSERVRGKILEILVVNPYFVGCLTPKKCVCD